MTDRSREPRHADTNLWPGAGEPPAEAGPYPAADGSAYYDTAPMVAYYGPDGQVAYYPAPSPQDEGLPPDPGWAALREAVWESGRAQPSSWPEGPTWGQAGSVAPPDAEAAQPTAVTPTEDMAPAPDPPLPELAWAQAEPQAVAATTELTSPPPPAPEPVARTLTVPVATVSDATTAAHKVVPRPTAAHRISRGRTAEGAGFRPSQAPYRIGIGRRMRSGFALVLIAVVVAGLLSAVLLALVAGIASAISHAASN